MAHVVPPKNLLDRVAIWCAKYLIFVLFALAFIVRSHLGLLFIVLPAAFAWAIAFLLQNLFRRRRPFQNGAEPLMQMLWETPSFPSAHTAMAASLAVAFLFDGTWNGLLFVLGAVVLAWSRVRVRVHYVTDTLAGAAVGPVAFYLAVASLVLLGVID